MTLPVKRTLANLLFTITQTAQAVQLLRLSKKQLKNLPKSKIKGKMKITDCNKNLNSKDQFQIEIDNEWYTVEANDFFDYLYNSSRIDGHDPIERTAWVESWETNWNPARQEWEEKPTGESHSYDWWIEEFVDNDDVLLDYMKTVFATYPVAEAA